MGKTFRSIGYQDHAEYKKERREKRGGKNLTKELSWEAQEESDYINAQQSKTANTEEEA